MPRLAGSWANQQHKLIAIAWCEELVGNHWYGPRAAGGCNIFYLDVSTLILRGMNVLTSSPRVLAPSSGGLETGKKQFACIYGVGFAYLF